ncbi:hypothetical protein DAI22_11g012200 [Oryza sativa Japonica Group]|uniref:Amidase domain-containing protein n=3 Tax=Oryza TaxID=4527 RepID=A0A0E0R3J4_ORYRU|nr:hypothetical protein DAI22_11g012200 [Oryza sativa Japonica Group]
MVLTENKTHLISLTPSLYIPTQSLQPSQLLHSGWRGPPRPTAQSLAAQATSPVRQCLSPGRSSPGQDHPPQRASPRRHRGQLRRAPAAGARRHRERASSHRYCGPLHGVPILKDNIVTRDRLKTTAGSFALLGFVVCRDASVTAGLRAAAATILGKANSSKWSNFRPVPNGWSQDAGNTYHHPKLSFFSPASRLVCNVFVKLSIKSPMLSTDVIRSSRAALA